MSIKTNTQKLSVDYLVQATGHRFAELRHEWGGRVFKAYPCDRYGRNLPPQVTVVGFFAAFGDPRNREETVDRPFQ